MTTPTNALDTGLPVTTFHVDPTVNTEMQPVLDAARIVQQVVSDSTRFVAMANEAIATGEYVSIILNAGLCNVQKAKAVDNTKIAVAFSRSDVASGAWGVFICVGNNMYRSGLTVGSMHYLSDTVAGGVTAVKPIGAGKIVQTIGFALSATELITNISLQFTQL